MKLTLSLKGGNSAPTIDVAPWRFSITVFGSCKVTSPPRETSFHKLIVGARCCLQLLNETFCANDTVSWL
jgi:hypothetical protein